jgi:hypothetical protein
MSQRRRTERVSFINSTFLFYIMVGLSFGLSSISVLSNQVGGSLPTETLAATRLKRKVRSQISGGLGHRLGKSGLRVIQGGLMGGRFDKYGYNLIHKEWCGSFVCTC